jgi:glutaredoxin
MTTDDLYNLRPSQIILYGVDWCPDCRRAKFFLKRKEIPFVEINVDQDAQAEAFVKQINRGFRSVPTIIFPDGSYLVEPSTDELANKFSKS